MLEDKCHTLFYIKQSSSIENNTFHVLVNLLVKHE